MTARLQKPAPPDAEERLVDLAGAVSDRQDVDWESAEELGPGVAGLRTLSRLAAAFDLRDLAPGDLDPEGRSGDEPLFRWGDLDVLEPLGEGRFGEVYRAHDRRLDRDVALKLGRDELDDLPRRGLTEARRLARVRHPNVLTVHGAAVHDGRAGIWTDLLGGESGGQTLEDRLERDGPFGDGELRLVGSELCRALAAVHGAGLVHGDVKTSNVVRDAEGRMVLVDFGSAFLARDAAPAILQATPSYLAPEVARGDASPTAGSDLYALGALLYRLATGEFWRGNDSRPLRDARPDLTPRLVRAIESLLAERTGDRPASAGEAERLLTEPGDASSSGRSRWMLAAGLLLGLCAAWLWLLRTPSPTDAVSDPATLWAERGGRSILVDQGATLQPGDRLSLRVHLAHASHLYVFNEDDAGELFVLFPLPGTGPRNPLAPGEHRLPSREHSWQVTSAGGRERFLIVGSAMPRPDLENFAGAQDVASPDRSVEVDPASPSRGAETETLRGVGGLTEAPGSLGDSQLARLHASLEPEASASLWVRLLEVDNPPR